MRSNHEGGRWKEMALSLKKQNDDLLEAIEEHERALKDKHFVFGMEQIGRVRRWPLPIVEFVMESLVAGVPPTALRKQIPAFVATIEPNIEIKQLPSILFIRRCRTTLMTVCQMVAAHRLSNAEVWRQIFTDGTSRRQTSLIDLIISICQGDDEPALPILMSSCILPKDETAEGNFDAIVAFLEERQEWLQLWKSKFEEMYPGVDHDINPDGINIGKMQRSCVMTDTCNTARKLNRMLCDYISEEIRKKLVEQQRRNVTVGDLSAAGEFALPNCSQVIVASTHDLICSNSSCHCRGG